MGHWADTNDFQIVYEMDQQFWELSATTSFSGFSDT